MGKFQKELWFWFGTGNFGRDIYSFKFGKEIFWENYYGFGFEQGIFEKNVNF